MNNQQLLDVASRLGYSLQQYGAETYRVEDSITRVLTALGAREINVFVINSCIMISIRSDTDETVSKIRRCKDKVTDLYKIERLNSLCRRICEAPLSYEEILTEIDAIERKKPYPFILKLLGFTLVSSGFCYVFGGAGFDILAAFCVSVVVYPLLWEMERLRAGLFFKNIIGSALIALLAILFSAFLQPVRLDKVIIGIFMNLVPGVALVNSMRDIIAGDLISGKNVLTEALIIALGMALGSGMMIALLQPLVTGGVL